MAIPSNIEELTTRLNQELEAIAAIATRGLQQTRVFLEQSPNDPTLVQFFGYLNNLLYFINLTSNQTRELIENLAEAETTVEEIQEAGEELSSSLGRAMEIRIEAEGLIRRLEQP